MILQVGPKLTSKFKNPRYRTKYTEKFLIFTLNIQLNCCGVDSPKDWTQILNNVTIPSSCCRNQTIAPANCTEEHAMKIGCKTVLLKHLENLSVRLAGVGFGIGWIQVRHLCISSIFFLFFFKFK